MDNKCSHKHLNTVRSSSGRDSAFFFKTAILWRALFSPRSMVVSYPYNDSSGLYNKIIGSSTENNTEKSMTQKKWHISIAEFFHRNNINMNLYYKKPKKEQFMIHICFFNYKKEI